jgi:hypothetical protein
MALAMSKSLQIITFPVVAVLATPLILLLAGIGMPLMFCMTIVDVRRLRKAVCTLPCVNCGQIPGLDSLALAAKEYAIPDPGVFDLYCGRLGEWTLDAICPNCGTRYSFVKGRLVAEAERLHGVQA